MEVRACALTGLAATTCDAVLRCLRADRARRGRPWALPLEQRVVIACTSLRTNLTLRELAAIFDLSRSQAHHIVTDIVPRYRRRLDVTIAGPPPFVGRRRNARAYARSPRRCQGQERPLVVQRAGANPSHRPSRDRRRRRRSRQSQRSASLPRNRDRTTVSAPRPRACGWRGYPSSLPPCFEGVASCETGVGTTIGGAERVSSTPFSTQGLAHSRRPSPASRATSSIATGHRCSAQSQPRITRQALAHRCAIEVHLRNAARRRARQVVVIVRASMLARCVLRVRS
jgi:hypothetical protein